MRALHKSIQHMHARVKSMWGESSHKCVLSVYTAPPSHEASVRTVMRPTMHPYTLLITDKTVIKAEPFTL